MRTVIVTCLSKTFRLAPEKVNAQTSQSNTPQWDSLGHLRLVVELERNLGVRFRTQDIPRITSVERIEQVLATMGGKK